MTVATTNARNVKSGNGSTTTFPFDFVFFDSSTIKVTLVDANDVETVKTETTDYTVSGGDGSTGSVETTSFTPASGESLVIERVEPFTQDVDLTERGSISSETLETRLDKNVMLTQRLLDLQNRSVLRPSTADPAADPLTVPEPVDGEVLVGKSDVSGWKSAALTDLGTAVVLSDTLPKKPLTTALAGTSTEVARQDHQHPVPDVSGLATRTGDAIGVPAASQAEAEAGTNNTKAMTPLRTEQWGDINLLTDLFDGSSTFTGDLDTLDDNLANGGMSVLRVETGATNTPSGATVNGSIVITMRWDANAGKQIFHEQGTTNVYARSEASDTWGAWAQIDAGAINDQTLAKGWVNFDGTGTLSVRDSFNVSSVTDNGMGDYTVNWDTDFANANYAPTVSMTPDTVSGGNQRQVYIDTVAAASLRLTTRSEGGTNVDFPLVAVAAFGDQ